MYANLFILAKAGWRRWRASRGEFSGEAVEEHGARAWVAQPASSPALKCGFQLSFRQNPAFQKSSLWIYRY